MQEMSPLEQTRLSFNDVNSFNSFLDPCGGVSTKFEEYCYHVGGEKMTEEQAQQYCDQEMDANLAKINSKEEKKRLCLGRGEEACSIDEKRLDWTEVAK